MQKTWNERYLDADTPWEEGEYSPEMAQLFTHYIAKDKSVLEVGCGLGTNAIWLASEGYNYLGVDISQEAIKQAKQNASQADVKAEFMVADVLKNPPIEKFDVVFDKGCLHNFTRKQDRDQFTHIVWDSLKQGGFWINISGNRDNPDAEGSVEKNGYPRLKASEITSLIEDKFQIHYMARCLYGNLEEYTRFLGWACVFQKR